VPNPQDGYVHGRIVQEDVPDSDKSESSDSTRSTQVSSVATQSFANVSGSFSKVSIRMDAAAIREVLILLTGMLLGAMLVSVYTVDTASVEF